MGEEWAASTPFPYFVDVPDDPDLAAAIRDGRRSEFAAFGWAPEEVPDPTDPATFESAGLRWEEVESGPHGTVLAFYRRLLALRRERPDLTDGRRALTTVTCDDGFLVVRRERTAVAANGSAATRRFAGASAVLLATREGVVLADGAVEVPPGAAVVVSLE
jgi:maltooligosyltrehalose trehalohydrolase